MNGIECRLLQAFSDKLINNYNYKESHQKTIWNQSMYTEFIINYSSWKKMHRWNLTAQKIKFLTKIPKDKSLLEIGANVVNPIIRWWKERHMCF